ncbi:MAG: gliding motility-associated ABC transporter ATP-binding subunit GldA [Flavobacteriales bacterium]|nr:gliding motility-associated ABC transporter ATP-binding subunit GldA [Flavobacteriales bacterium]MDG1779930.1 gliding motility-associated ABC transporter ATP-binding subunit GldA [Flavobacteriales bacterium]MDG2247230.1 gliding motility-associated ABC transporter ATP-binding subunit GldA [Flavobacteriales bacterium]
MSIEIKNVSKLYGKQTALNDVSFSIAGGEVVGFLGPNGAGKSTMMKIITSFIPPTEGQATVCGFDVSTDPIEVRKKVGYLPEHNPLYLDMYVKEFLHFVAGVHKIPNPAQKIEEMIEKVGLGREQHKLLGALSKGYRQRVGLAQAMIHDPEVLILDEPTSGLDPNQLVEIRELIRTIGKEKTVMLSTHIMQEVEAICSRVIIVNQGNIVADGPTSEIRNLASTNQQLVEVEFDGPVEAAELLAIEGIEDAKHIGNNTWRLRSVSEIDPRKTISAWAVEQDRLVLTLKREEQRLEDVFHTLTK